MANTLRILSICIITLIAFIYGFNIFLTKQVNDLVYAPKGIDIHTFEQGQVNVVAAPWYNLVLSGQHLIYNNDIAYIVINVTADSVITTSASDLVIATLLAPINIIILLLLALAVSWLISLRFKNKIENQRLDFLNNQFIELLSGLNIAINSHHTKRTQLEQLQNNFQSLSTYITNYTRETEVSIYQDKLTHLIDRHAYIEHLAKQLRIAEVNKFSCALLFIDLDGFKQVNDSFGHSFGDDVLIQVASRLSSVLRHHKISNISPISQLEQNLARLGGDEFSIFINLKDNKGKALEVAQNVLHEIERDFVLGNKLIKISASIGIAVYPDSAATPQALLQMADVAMYRAKTDGRGIFKVYSPEMGKKIRRYHYLLEEMRLAISSNSFHLSFQPIVHVDDCAIDYFEALVRWEHPVEGFITPDEFIPIAEESNLILELGDWIMLESCRQMSAWYNAGMNKVSISVNLSGVQLKHYDIYEWVMEKLAKTGLPAKALMLEITESTLIKASNKIIESLEKLRGEGITIAIDDFGTGFSSLSTLADLPIDVIKLDKLFVSQANDNLKYNEIMHSVSELGRKLGLKIVAEGVEELAQFELVKSMGINCVQGYLVSHPESSVNVGHKVLQDNINFVSVTGTGVWNIQQPL
ncbi:EAL domain-containing protein [Pseudoalteromonas sp. SCSIO 43101]|uniref:putative bifunctional diguanylate cyclase/phosphodiesterase n=1 Tax=Pseudoalteromonas sp. SCSIO 43101 TaxID=2822847 RepID=UPI00202B8A5C|nr:EAL domain-containing protein [Pseudoalteromonas sp. SCSIO 43101]URQ92544.1 EAL domain-containing protein [Pseudoalteromonas sp. SCSIO 43101]